MALLFLIVGIAIKSKVLPKRNIRRLSKNITSLQKCSNLKWSVSRAIESYCKPIHLSSKEQGKLRGERRDCSTLSITCKLVGTRPQSLDIHEEKIQVFSFMTVV